MNKLLDKDEVIALAKGGKLTFTLAADDPLGWVLVNTWANMAIFAGHSMEKVQEAQTIAVAMQAQWCALHLENWMKDQAAKYPPVTAPAAQA